MNELEELLSPFQLTFFEQNMYDIVTSPALPVAGYIPVIKLRATANLLKSLSQAVEASETVPHHSCMFDTKFHGNSTLKYQEPLFDKVTYWTLALQCFNSDVDEKSEIIVYNTALQHIYDSVIALISQKSDESNFVQEAIHFMNMCSKTPVPSENTESLYVLTWYTIIDYLPSHLESNALFKDFLQGNTITVMNFFAYITKALQTRETSWGTWFKAFFKEQPQNMYPNLKKIQAKTRAMQNRILPKKTVLSAVSSFLAPVVTQNVLIGVATAIIFAFVMSTLHHFDQNLGTAKNTSKVLENIRTNNTLPENENPEQKVENVIPEVFPSSASKDLVLYQDQGSPLFQRALEPSSGVVPFQVPVAQPIPLFRALPFPGVSQGLAPKFVVQVETPLRQPSDTAPAPAPTDFSKALAVVPFVQSPFPQPKGLVPYQVPNTTGTTLLPEPLPLPLPLSLPTTTFSKALVPYQQLPMPSTSTTEEAKEPQAQVPEPTATARARAVSKALVRFQQQQPPIIPFRSPFVHQKPLLIQPFFTTTIALPLYPIEPSVALEHFNNSKQELLHSLTQTPRMSVKPRDLNNIFAISDTISRLSNIMSSVTAFFDNPTNEQVSKVYANVTEVQQCLVTINNELTQVNVAPTPGYTTQLKEQAVNALMVFTQQAQNTTTQFKDSVLEMGDHFSNRTIELAKLTLNELSDSVTYLIETSSDFLEQKKRDIIDSIEESRQFKYQTPSKEDQIAFGRILDSSGTFADVGFSEHPEPMLPTNSFVETNLFQKLTHLNSLIHIAEEKINEGNEEIKQQKLDFLAQQMQLNPAVSQSVNFLMTKPYELENQIRQFNISLGQSLGEVEGLAQEQLAGNIQNMTTTYQALMSTKNEMDQLFENRTHLQNLLNTTLFAQSSSFSNDDEVINTYVSQIRETREQLENLATKTQTLTAHVSEQEQDAITNEASLKMNVTRFQFRSSIIDSLSAIEQTQQSKSNMLPQIRLIEETLTTPFVFETPIMVEAKTTIQEQLVFMQQKYTEATQNNTRLEELLNLQKTEADVTALTNLNQEIQQVSTDIKNAVSSFYRVSTKSLQAKALVLKASSHLYEVNNTGPVYQGKPFFLQNDRPIQDLTNAIAKLNEKMAITVPNTDPYFESYEFLKTEMNYQKQLLQKKILELQYEVAYENCKRGLRFALEPYGIQPVDSVLSIQAQFESEERTVVPEDIEKFLLDRDAFLALKEHNALNTSSYELMTPVSFLSDTFTQLSAPVSEDKFVTTVALLKKERNMQDLFKIQIDPETLPPNLLTYGAVAKLFNDKCTSIASNVTQLSSSVVVKTLRIQDLTAEITNDVNNIRQYIGLMQGNITQLSNMLVTRYNLIGQLNNVSPNEKERYVKQIQKINNMIETRSAFVRQAEESIQQIPVDTHLIQLNEQIGYLNNTLKSQLSLQPANADIQFLQERKTKIDEALQNQDIPHRNIYYWKFLTTKHLLQNVGLQMSNKIQEITHEANYQKLSAELKTYFQEYSYQMPGVTKPTLQDLKGLTIINERHKNKMINLFYDIDTQLQLKKYYEVPNGPTVYQLSDQAFNLMQEISNMAQEVKSNNLIVNQEVQIDGYTLSIAQSELRQFDDQHRFLSLYTQGPSYSGFQQANLKYSSKRTEFFNALTNFQNKIEMKKQWKQDIVQYKQALEDYNNYAENVTASLGSTEFIGLTRPPSNNQFEYNMLQKKLEHLKNAESAMKTSRKQYDEGTSEYDLKVQIDTKLNDLRNAYNALLPEVEKAKKVATFKQTNRDIAEAISKTFTSFHKPMFTDGKWLQLQNEMKQDIDELISLEGNLGLNGFGKDEKKHLFDVIKRITVRGKIHDDIMETDASYFSYNNMDFLKKVIDKYNEWITTSLNRSFLSSMVTYVHEAVLEKKIDSGRQYINALVKEQARYGTDQKYSEDLQNTILRIAEPLLPLEEEVYKYKVEIFGTTDVLNVKLHDYNNFERVFDKITYTRAIY